MKFSPYKIFTYLVVIIAYIVVIYKLVDYDNYGDLWLHFTKNLSSHWVYLLICITLMPVNILMEAIKWRAAVANIENISVRQAITATLKGQVGAIATPNKLGDFPTRASSLKLGNRTIGTIMGFVAAWTLSIVIILIGMLGAMLYIAEYHTDSVNSQYLMLTVAICIAATILIFSIPHIAKRINSDRINSPKIKNSLHALQHLEAKKLISLSALSLVRYLIFCAQLMFMLMFFGINISIYQAVISIPTIYLLSTITPTIVASEAATRSGYAILILSPISQAAPTIALATSLLWALNCGFPIIIGSFLFHQTQKHC